MKKKASLIALYLPQFHETVENNLWWGNGFTDWDSVRNAKSYFRGHNQPRAPKNLDYYNLLDKRVMERQVNLSRKAGIEGFCFYHYWFGGKKLLEKPVENYLKWKDLKQNYCLSWANDSWVRSWSNIAGNDWNPVGDQNINDKKQSILIEQIYGGCVQWKEHFDYLLPFFRDERYIKIDGKPIFLVYRPDIIPCFHQMMRFWKRLAKENGLNGLYVIVTNPTKKYEKTADGIMIYEPGYTMRNEANSLKNRGDEHLRIYDYSEVWWKILIRKNKYSKPVYLGAFVDYDDSPRRGREDSDVMINITPQKFAVYMRLLLKKSKKKKYGNYIFVMAWNEWGEGAYLEADEQNGYQFLSACKWAVKHS